MRFLATFTLGIVFAAGSALAGEKGLMHCFAFTVIDSATPEQWSAFGKATDDLPGKVKGLRRVWHGKLVRPLTQYQLKFADDAARKQFTESGSGSTEVKMLRRQHGVCMDFDSEAAFKAYDADPAHKAWVSSYEKVRVAGTTTYQILGE